MSSLSIVKEDEILDLKEKDLVNQKLKLRIISSHRTQVSRMNLMMFSLEYKL